MVSALLSIAVSTVGVVDQVRVSDEARAERLTEHAVRVAWWRGDGVNGGTFVIQNRSLVPLDSVVLRYSAAYADGREPSSELVPIDEGPIFAFWSIAPCTIIALNEAAIEAHYLPRSPETGNTTNITSVYWQRLDFTDVHGRWAVTSGHEPVQAEPFDVRDLNLEGGLLISDLTYLRDTEGWVTEEPASDCGTG